MQIVETLLLLLASAALVAWMLQHVVPRPVLIVLGVAGTVLAGVHLGMSPYRWQAWGAYLVLGIVLFRQVRPFKPREVGRKQFVYVVEKVAGVAVLASSFLFVYLCPLATLPEPGGRYKIGTTNFFWTDPARTMVYGETPDAPRALVVQVWYPAAGVEGEPEPWLPEFEEFIGSLAADKNLPYLTFGYLQEITSHSYSRARIVETPERLPVVVYSHGWTGFRHVALDEIEKLASNGYVVFAPDHTYGALVTVHPNGEAIPNDDRAMPPREPADARQVGIEKLVETYAGDISFVIDQAEKLNEGSIESPLAGRLDMERIGVWGHSTGGGATVRSAIADARVKSAVGLDPWVEPIPEAMRTQPIRAPFLSIRCEDWYNDRDANNAVLETIREHAGAPFHDYYLEGTTHYDFTVIGLLSPAFSWLGVNGPTPAPRALNVVNTAMLGFFNDTLEVEGGMNGLADGEPGADASDFAAALKTTPELKPATRQGDAAAS